MRLTSGNGEGLVRLRTKDRRVPNNSGQEILSLTSFTWGRSSLSEKREGGLSFSDRAAKDRELYAKCDSFEFRVFMFDYPRHHDHTSRRPLRGKWQRRVWPGMDAFGSGGTSRQSGPSRWTWGAPAFAKPASAGEGRSLGFDGVGASGARPSCQRRDIRVRAYRSRGRAPLAPLQRAPAGQSPLDMGFILHFSRKPGGSPFSKQ
jgi:hypothetical protein